MGTIRFLRSKSTRQGLLESTPMPTVFRSGPYRFYFYSHEPNEPPHVHVDHDLGWVVGIFHRKKLLNRVVPFLAGLVRVNRDDATLVAAFEERIAADGLHK